MLNRGICRAVSAVSSAAQVSCLSGQPSDTANGLGAATTTGVRASDTGLSANTDGPARGEVNDDPVDAPPVPDGRADRAAASPVPTPNQPGMNRSTPSRSIKRPAAT